mmetsp:Transcript_7524/g.17197  ORF Transcript_7524/g.17197 Transcript_7524/m.17197 type:complete len:307 (+) Transcript_7524:899-1819(+)
MSVLRDEGLREGSRPAGTAATRDRHRGQRRPAGQAPRQGGHACLLVDCAQSGSVQGPALRHELLHYHARKTGAVGLGLDGRLVLLEELDLLGHGLGEAPLLQEVDHPDVVRVGHGRPADAHHARQARARRLLYFEQPSLDGVFEGQDLRGDEEGVVHEPLGGEPGHVPLAAEAQRRRLARAAAEAGRLRVQLALVVAVPVRGPQEPLPDHGQPEVRLPDTLVHVSHRPAVQNHALVIGGSLEVVEPRECLTLLGVECREARAHGDERPPRRRVFEVRVEPAEQRGSVLQHVGRVRLGQFAEAGVVA